MASDDRVWDEWPSCSQCGRRRQTVCPTCGNAGNEFLLAEYQAMAAPQRSTRRLAESNLAPESTPLVLLMCSHCDEAFAPQFYRICPACGRDAGHGVKMNRRDVDRVSGRVMLALYGLVALAALMLLYFWFLFRDQ